MVTSLSILTTQQRLTISGQKTLKVEQLFAPFGSLDYPPSSRGHSPLPGVDGPAATSGLIEFPFATFFGQKWDVVPFLLVTSTP
jgi:hypothetical protein